METLLGFFASNPKAEIAAIAFGLVLVIGVLIRIVNSINWALFNDTSEDELKKANDYLVAIGEDNRKPSMGVFGYACLGAVLLAEAALFGFLVADFQEGTTAARDDETAFVISLLVGGFAMFFAHIVGGKLYNVGKMWEIVNVWIDDPDRKDSDIKLGAKTITLENTFDDDNEKGTPQHIRKLNRFSKFSNANLIAGKNKKDNIVKFYLRNAGLTISVFSVVVLATALYTDHARDKLHMKEQIKQEERIEAQENQQDFSEPQEHTSLWHQDTTGSSLQAEEKINLDKSSVFSDINELLNIFFSAIFILVQVGAVIFSMQYSLAGDRSKDALLQKNKYAIQNDSLFWGILRGFLRPSLRIIKKRGDPKEETPKAKPRS